jgi:hypothetical protein
MARSLKGEKIEELFQMKGLTFSSNLAEIKYQDH